MSVLGEDTLQYFRSDMRFQPRIFQEHREHLAPRKICSQELEPREYTAIWNPYVLPQNLWTSTKLAGCTS